MIRGVLAQIAPGNSPPPIKDIAPPVDVFPYPLSVVVAGIIAAIIVLSLLGWLLWKWLRSRPAPPPLPPRAVAMSELTQLRAQVRTMEPYAFSIAVSDVLRRYISAEYDLHALEQTSPEFLMSISSTPRFSERDKGLLADFLGKCDLIKFARISADAEDSEQLLTSAISFVQGSRA